MQFPAWSKSFRQPSVGRCCWRGGTRILVERMEKEARLRGLKATQGEEIVGPMPDTMVLDTSSWEAHHHQRSIAIYRGTSTPSSFVW